MSTAHIPHNGSKYCTGRNTPVDKFDIPMPAPLHRRTGHSYQSQSTCNYHSQGNYRVCSWCIMFHYRIKYTQICYRIDRSLWCYWKRSREGRICMWRYWDIPCNLARTDRDKPLYWGLGSIPGDRVCTMIDRYIFSRNLNIFQCMMNFFHCCHLLLW